MSDALDIFAERIDTNPFQPNREVSPDRFSGRKKEAQELRKTLVYACRGEARNHAIVGDRGIGKTSLLNFVEKAIPELPDFEEMAPPMFVTCSLGACSSVEDVAAALMDAIIAATTPNASLHRSIRQFLDRLESVKVSGFGVSFRNADGRKASIRFPSILKDLYDRLGEEFSGLVVVLDETDRIAELRGFPDFIKATSEQLRREEVSNVSFVLSAIPAAWKQMNEHNASFSRIFYVEELEPLADEEVSDFLERTLQHAVPETTYTEGFEQLLIDLSEGIPSFFQHLGYYAFEHDTDQNLDKDDLIRGLKGTDSKPGALEQLEQKFFRRLYLNLVQSNTYREILHIMAESSSQTVEISEIKQNIESTEPQNVGSYVGNMVKRGVINKVKGKRGLYQLPNLAFKVFLRLKDMEDGR